MTSAYALRSKATALLRMGAVFAALFVSLGLFQSQIDSVRRIEIAQAVMLAESTAQARAATAKTDDGRRRFEERLNRLAAALEGFKREYDASGGHLWPKKKADALEFVP